MKEIQHFLSKPNLDLSFKTHEDFDSEWIKSMYCSEDRALVVRIDWDLRRSGDGLNEESTTQEVNHRVTECYWENEGEQISLDDETEKLLISMVQ